MITGQFDASNAYEVGDVVIKDDVLYKFTSAHTASDPWDSSEVTATTMVALVNAALVSAKSYTDTSVATAKTTVEGLISDEFAAANAYSVGDIVTHEDGLYKFKAAHTAGDAWSASEVDAVQVADLIEAAEPDSLTPEQIADLEGLLD